MTDDSMLQMQAAKPAKAQAHPDSWEPELAELRQRQALARQMAGRNGWSGSIKAVV